MFNALHLFALTAYSYKSSECKKKWNWNWCWVWWEILREILKFQSARHDQDCLISDAISVVPRQSTVLAELAEDRPIAGRQTVESALQPTSLNGKRTGIYTYLNFCAHWCFHPNILESLNLSDQEDYDSVSRLYGYSYSIVRRCGTRTECYVTTLFQQLNWWSL